MYMEECPICRTNIVFLSVTKSPLLEELIKQHCAEPQVINYYTLKMDSSNIINYYLRKPNIECPICFNNMNDSKILSCGHVICLECNKKLDWNKGKFITADIWRNKYYETIIRIEDIVKQRDRDIQNLMRCRDHFRERMEFYMHKTTLYKNQLKKKCNNKYRTQICNWWLQGMCKYSDEECRYAHGENYLLLDEQ